jgi:predicted enzyme related to lactoylglutathione lyase
MKLSEVAIFTDAVEDTIVFYERLLNRAPFERGEGIAIFDVEGVHVLVHQKYDASESELPSESHFGFSVADLESTVGMLSERGYAVQFPPRDYPWGRSAYLRDPAGNLVQLSE